MKRIVALTVLLLALPAAAGAHVLTLPGAMRVAAREADRVAAAFPVRVTAQVSSCRRITPHMVHCRAWFDGDDIVCRRVIRVSFPSATSRNVRVSYPYKPRCY